MSKQQNEDQTMRHEKRQNAFRLLSIAVLTIGIAVRWAGIAQAQQWTMSGNDIYNSNSGNVGIGTTGPGAKLDIKSPSSGTNKILRVSDVNGTDVWDI